MGDRFSPATATDSSIPVCARLTDRAVLRWIPAALLAIGLTGCADELPSGNIEITDAQARWNRSGIVVTIRQRLDLGPRVEEALRNGVVITIRMDAALYQPGGMGRLVGDLDRYELRYLPLSDRFQLSPPRGAAVRTYPRLRHALADLAELRMPLVTDADPEESWELRVRSRLDHGQLPAPMRLPAWLSRSWRLDTHWTRWPAGGAA